jgi:formylmethanofuran dehydrogenase subunit E
MRDATMMQELLKQSAERHTHLCPRQVLGVRMGMKAGEVLGLALPQSDKRLFTFVEMDGCMTDGIAVSTGCSVGRRTMRVMSFGKVAATFVDTLSEQAVRIRPHPQARRQISRYAPDAPDRWHAYLSAYQVMPDEVLLIAEPVNLTVCMAAIISDEKARVRCSKCGEEIFNQREVVENGLVLCHSCAGDSYWASASRTADLMEDSFYHAPRAGADAETTLWKLGEQLQ